MADSPLPPLREVKRSRRAQDCQVVFERAQFAGEANSTGKSGKYGVHHTLVGSDRKCRRFLNPEMAWWVKSSNINALERHDALGYRYRAHPAEKSAPRALRDFGPVPSTGAR